MDAKESINAGDAEVRRGRRKSKTIATAISPAKRHHRHARVEVRAAAAATGYPRDVGPERRLHPWPHAESLYEFDDPNRLVPVVWKPEDFFQGPVKIRGRDLDHATEHPGIRGHGEKRVRELVGRITAPVFAAAACR